MLKELILIEDGKSYQFSTEKELVEHLLGNNYYNATRQEQVEQMRINGKFNSVNTPIEVVDLQELDEGDINNKFVIYDEKTYILSLLLANRYTLLERKDSNVFTSAMKKDKIEENYIIVNTFAKEILKRYINKIKNQL